MPQNNNEGFLGFLRKVKPEKREIEVTTPDIEETFFEERDEIRLRAADKINQARRNGNSPFFEEDLLTAEELESL